MPPNPRAEFEARRHRATVASCRHRSLDELIGPEKQRLLDRQSQALAVLRLKMNANFEACSTGIVAGLPPLRILSTKYGARCQSSGKFTPYASSPPPRRIRPTRRQAGDSRQTVPQPSHVGDEHRVTEYDQTICPAPEHQCKRVIELSGDRAGASRSSTFKAVAIFFTISKSTP